MLFREKEDKLWFVGLIVILFIIFGVAICGCETYNREPQNSQNKSSQQSEENKYIDYCNAAIDEYGMADRAADQRDFSAYAKHAYSAYAYLEKAARMVNMDVNTWLIEKAPYQVVNAKKIAQLSYEINF